MIDRPRYYESDRVIWEFGPESGDTARSPETAKGTDMTPTAGGASSPGHNSLQTFGTNALIRELVERGDLGLTARVKTWDDLYAALRAAGYEKAAVLIESWQDEYLPGRENETLPREDWPRG